MRQTINDLNNLVKSRHGNDIVLSLARSPAFGHEDICYVVQGAKRAAVARDLLMFLRDGKITESSSEFMGRVTHSTIIEGMPS
ncbi:MAG TPA: hypothetical protein PLE21_00520 [Giesbergeria sp.]|nr:hypothetical protein [Giesbergeria sp.]